MRLTPYSGLVIGVINANNIQAMMRPMIVEAMS